ncbi:MAG: hypothetical protein JKY80_06925 [Mariprofundaceae bacterium]|nr:hypothetical protein [Mariprofundaceae bacterium]
MFLRYQSAFLCQMFANSALSNNEYRDFADKTMDRAYEILGKEVDLELARTKANLPKTQVKKKKESITFSKPRITTKDDEYTDTTVTLPAELVKGFYEMSLGFRKFKSSKAYAYKPVMHANGIVLDGNSIKFKPSVTSPDSGSYNSGDILEASIKIISIKGNEPQYYHVPSSVVFYKADEEKIKLLANKQILTWDAFKNATKLTFQLPEHAKQGYKDFNQIRMISVQVDVNDAGESFEIVAKVITKSDTKWEVKLMLDKDNEQIYKELHKNHDITLSFKASQLKSLDVPEVVGTIIINKEEKRK